MKKNIKILVSIVVLSFVILLITFKINEVSKELTEEDVVYIQKFMKSNSLDTFSLDSYEKEVKLIKSVQKNVLTQAPKNKGILHFEPREPKDIYERGYGLCYDRSRVIEKILNKFGFETRHIAAYWGGNKSKWYLPDYLNKKSQSHAFTEVLTSKGWMFIDSNNFFMGFDENDNPISISNVQNKGFDKINWSKYNMENYNGLYSHNGFTFIYGLYSRHGYFYPPYNFIPDLNLGEAKYNLF